MMKRKNKILKKSIILLVLCVFLCGCNVNYELTINKDTIKENILISSEEYNDSYIIEVNQKPVEAFNDSPVYSESNEKIDGVEYYNIRKELNNNLYNMYMDYEFKFDEYKKSNVVNTSVSLFNFNKENDIYTIATGANIKAFTLYNGINNLTVTVNLSNDYELINSNATSINGNVLTWNINNRYKSLVLSFKEKESEKDPTINNPIEDPGVNEPSNTTEDFILIGLLFLAFIGVLTGVIIVSKKVRK